MGYIQRCQIALKQRENYEPSERNMFDFEIETYKNANNLKENAMCLIFAKMCKG